MTRRRTLLAAGTALVVVAVVAAVVVLATRDDGPSRPSAAATAYARTWDATCAALRTDAAETTAAVRARVAGGASDAERRATARSLVAPYLGRIDRRLRRVSAAVPPPEWRAYHAGIRGRLDTAAARVRSTQERVRRGDLQAPSDLVVSDLTRSADAPEALRRLTPACGSPGAT